MAFAFLVARPAISSAATWSTNRTTPTLAEIVAIDATVVPPWPFGQEDLIQEGSDASASAETSVDLRTVYAATDSQRFWLRAYVSGETVLPTAVVYVFIDSDQTPATGGTTQAPEIDPGLTNYRPSTGYEHVLGVTGNGTFAGAWEWNAAQSRYVDVRTKAANATAEAGQDVDPIILFSALHGYVQASVEFPVISLAQTCAAFLDVRLVAGTALDDAMGQTAPCVPVDSNADHVPDIVIPPSGCTSDEYCPAGGRCVNGICVVTASCNVDMECATGRRCVNHACAFISCVGDNDCTVGHCLNRVCVVSSCNLDSECSGGRCVDHVCIVSTACTTDGECAATHQCVGGQCVVRSTGACSTDGECAATHQCVGGQCVVRSTGACSSNAQCGDRICRNGQCVACTAGGTDCGAGYRCTSDGRCAAAVALAQGEKVEGGALRCAMDNRVRMSAHGLGWAAFLLVGPIWRGMARRMKRHGAKTQGTEGR